MLIARIAINALAAFFICCPLLFSFPSGINAAAGESLTEHVSTSETSPVYKKAGRIGPAVRSGPANALRLLGSSLLKPLSLTSADFNSDGMPDVVIGYGDDNGGWVAEPRWGNPDSLYPNSPEALMRKAENRFSDEPFQAGSVLIPLPIKPDFLAAGDFNGDGLQDLACGAGGQPFFFVIPGNGAGEFEKPVRIDLEAPLTILHAGDINRRDGLPELIAGVSGDNGAALVVYEGPGGAMGAVPEVISLPGEAVEVVLGNFDDNYPWDMAVLLSSGEVVMVYGRDRQLSFEPRRRAAVPHPAPVLLSLPHSVALAAGNFLGAGQDVLASLSSDGRLSLVNPRQPSASLLTKSVSGMAESNQAKPSKSGLVTIPKAGADQLIAFGGGRPSLSLAGSLTGTEAATASITLDSPAVALLPMRLNADAFADLLVLGDDSNDPLRVISTKSGAIFTVNSTGCSPDIEKDGVCADEDGKCTLVAAMSECEGGSCTIRFDIPGSGVPEVCLYGTAPGVFIDGTSQPGGFVRINQTTIGGNIFKANTVLRGIIFDDAEVGDNSKVEGCQWTHELSVASNCTVGGTTTSARNKVMLQSGAAGLLIQGNGNVVQGNWFGYNPEGPSPNSDAIRLFIPLGQTTSPSNNIIGGTTASARNIIVATVLMEIGTGNLFQGNYLGTDPSGMVAAGSIEGASGILLGGIANTVGGAVAAARNLIVGAGNGKYGHGINVAGPPTSTQGPVIQGNYIGLDATGTNRIGTWQRGVHISAESESIILGGSVSGAGNVISGSSWCGVIVQGKDDKTGVQGTSCDHVIQGNYIGTDKTGTVAIPNLYGMLITHSHDNLVGGTTAAARNVISGNAADAIHILGDTAGETGYGNTITGNYIGVDSTGMVKLPQPGWGVYIESSRQNTVGGLTSSARNVISCNGQGNVRIQNAASTGNKIHGNYLGTARDGVSNPGVGGYWGVLVAGGAANNAIGGTQTDAGNTIAYNTQSGVTVITDTSTGNSILRNSIHSNGILAIDLGFDGITPNHVTSPTTGPNRYQNAPVLADSETPTGWSVKGTLHSIPSTTFRIDFYSNCGLNTNGFAEGRTWLRSINVQTSSMGDAIFNETFPVTGCSLFTATATDPDGNTSEMSIMGTGQQVGPSGGTIEYTGGNGLKTTIAIPEGAVPNALTFVYTETNEPSQALPAGLKSAGNAFIFAAYNGGAIMDGYEFQEPAVITIKYSDEEISGIAESSLKLYFWDGTQWADAANTCTPASEYTRNPANNTISIPVCRVGEYVLAGSSSSIVPILELLLSDG